MTQERRLYGLIGRHIGHSFSRAYFTAKFRNEGLEGYEYVNFDLPDIAGVTEILKRRDIAGLNVTIPYKETVIPYLDDLSATAKEIGAVNTIEFRDGRTIGHNTDYIGFSQSIAPLLHRHHTKALILGTGGASKAVLFALERLGISATRVSSSGAFGSVPYGSADISAHRLVVNCTPLGTFPDTDAFPPIDYDGFTPDHLAFDLIYNPEKTVFLQKAEAKGAAIRNGYDMLVGQAGAAWAIWRS